jgi:hypothetical protein
MTEPRQTTPPPGPDPTQPPQGDGWNGQGWDWQQPYGPPGRAGLPDLSPILAILESLRRMVPAELQDQFNALQREVLLTIKALIDWYLERLDARDRPVKVEDIPID